MNQKLTAVFFAIALLSLGGTLTARGAQEGSDGLEVVASFSVLGDLVSQIGGERINLATLVGPGGDPHVFEPSPRDAMLLSRARLVFANGLELESWLEDLYSASGSRGTLVELGEAVSNLLEADHHDDDHHDDDHHDDDHHDDDHHDDDHHDDDHHDDDHHDDDDDHGHEDDHGHHHGEYDPHVWMSVRNVIEMVEAIREALVQADPQGADYYNSRAEAYGQELSQLDSWITAQVQTLPENRRSLVTVHNSLAYFARDYGFVLVGDLLSSLSTEASEPSASDMARLVEEILRQGVVALFPEVISSTRLLERVAREAGIPLAAPLYTGALGNAGSPAQDYVNMMRYNTETIVRALGE